ncbi:hypothetical protein AYO47_03885 [Planctomyces sp. SCGC AG-212-M04]|nr:hypothetical protein AYO47_03885 [Planctomyces sp. SCGC AG-212-M04]
MLATHTATEPNLTRLVKLVSEGPTTVEAAATALNISHSYANRMLKRGEELGAFEKGPRRSGFRGRPYFEYRLTRTHTPELAVSLMLGEAPVAV